MATIYTLTWGTPGQNSGSTITTARALELISSWRNHGSVAGSLAAGEVRFVDNFGKRAVIQIKH